MYSSIFIHQNIQNHNRSILQMTQLVSTHANWVSLFLTSLGYGYMSKYNQELYSGSERHKLECQPDLFALPDSLKIKCEICFTFVCLINFQVLQALISLDKINNFLFGSILNHASQIYSSKHTWGFCKINE